MAAQATKGAALAVIKRMFEDPIPRLLPSRTKVWQQIEGESGTYSPEKWADPLLLFKWQLGGEEDIAEVMPATGVTIYSMQFDQRYLQQFAKPDYSAFGKSLKAMLESVNQYQYDEEDLEYLTSSAEWSMAKILYQFERQSFIYLKDEAAIVRLLLLQIMLSKPTDLMQASSFVQQIAVNMNVKKDSCTGSWRPPPEISNSSQIGTETSTSSLYVLAIDELDTVILKDESLKDMEPSSFVYIPVCRSWSGRSWLMAYILSFTSTCWWNFAYTLDVEYSNGVSEATEGLPMKATFMPKAATVYIHGNYSNICLVVIDATRSQFPDDWQFEVCKGITASRAGNFEFAKKAHAYLGRLSDPDVMTISCGDISVALDNMACMVSPTELRQLHLKASILATSRFNGFSCYPNPEPTKNRKHIFGPVAFNNKDEILIGDYVVPDLAKMAAEERQTRLQVLNFWRCDPIGFLTHNAVDLQRDRNINYFFQYRLSTSTNDLRILRACGAFTFGGPNFVMPRDLFDTMGYASLMLGLTNWYLVEMGCTLFEHNYISHYKGYHKHLEFQGIWEKITSLFVIDFGVMNINSFLEESLKKVGRIINFSQQEESLEADWTKTHFSGNVPWWFVAVIAEKFGQNFKVKARIDFKQNEIGWRINAENNEQYDLSILTASSKYEQKVLRSRGPYFPILTTKRNGTNSLTHNMISWDMNRLLDGKKSQLSNICHRGNVGFNGIVELNVIILPKANKFESVYAFVAADNRIIADDPNYWPQALGLEWFYMSKDYLDWLGTVPE